MVEENVVKLKKIHIKKYLKHVDKGCSQAEVSIVHWDNMFELHVMEL